LVDFTLITSKKKKEIAYDDCFTTIIFQQVY